jgi:hypothetical protein
MKHLESPLPALSLGISLLVACGGPSHTRPIPALADAGAAGADAQGNTGAAGMPAAGAPSNTEPDRDVEVPPVEGGRSCVLHIDCVAGTYCDLNVCRQDCNTEEPCERGETCSPRGQCTASGDVESERPVLDHAGSVTASPLAIELDEADTSFELALSSDSLEAVEYRVEVKAPFLRLLDAARSSFEHATTLRFAVDPTQVDPGVTAGNVLVHTSLGTLSAHPSLRVGLSGSYQGVLRYDADWAPFGEVSLVVDIADEHGDLKLQIDPELSMTFPDTGSGAARGRGIYTLSEGVSASVEQALSADYGGTRNHFRRALGQRLSFALRPETGGALEGRFTQTLYGLFSDPVEVAGSVYLEPRQLGRAIAVSDPGPVTQPTLLAPSYPAASSVFPGWLDSACQPACTTLTCIESFESPLFAPLALHLTGGSLEGTDPLGDLALECEGDQALSSSVGYRGRCALGAPLACAAQRLASAVSAPLADARNAYNRLFARALAPSVIVAQNHVVRALEASFVSGIQAEVLGLEAARNALDPMLDFALSSGALHGLRDFLAGNPEGVLSEDPTRSNYPAGRALARALYIEHTLDAELARIDAVRPNGSADDERTSAQARGVLSLFEAAALARILEAWGHPAGLGGESTGLLTVADRGFSDLRNGALVFGVADGEVPMVYDSAHAPLGNFEQVLDLRAAPSLEQFHADEAAFLGQSREFEADTAALNAEIEGARRAFDDQILSACGPSFELATLSGDLGWERCGEAGEGEIGELGLQIEQALLSLSQANARLDGMQRKYEVDERRLAETQGVHRDTMRFVASTGEQLIGLTLAEGVINMAQEALSIASNASLFNAGAPLGEAAASAALEWVRTGITAERQRLNTAQELRAVADASKVELIAGMAELQKQLIDMEQLGLDIQQATLGVLQADTSRRNALARARRAFDERSRSLARIEQNRGLDPFGRVLETRLALQAFGSRAAAQRWLMRAARALEYEINTPLGSALDRAVLGAYNSNEAARLQRCLKNIRAEHAAAFGTAQEFTTELSVREMLGITGPREDEATGETLSAGDLFRATVFTNEHIDDEGNVTVTFSTNLMPGNGLWSSNVCDDKVARVQAQLVGDFQGDNEAELHVLLAGGSVLRACGSEDLVNWELESQARAVLQAGINDYGDAAPSTSLFGQSVARASFALVLPSALSAPANADLDFARLDDIVLKITHRALPSHGATATLDTSCLGTVGAGG